MSQLWRTAIIITYFSIYKLEKLKTIFNPGTPFFMEMYQSLSEDELDESTQLKIEKFLQNQGKLLFDKDLEKKMERFWIRNLVGVTNVDGELDRDLTKILINSKNDFNKLIIIKLTIQ
jgi:hypothetical protein